MATFPIVQRTPLRLLQYCQRNALALLDFLRRDGRHFQLIWLSSFLLYGIFAIGWNVELWRYATLIGTCLSVQMLGVAAVNQLRKGDWRLSAQDFSTLKSAGITSLGLSLLCKANSPMTLVLVAAIAIGSKFLVRFQGKHIFNPANVGIIAAILLTGDAWISPGQWGSNAVLLFFIGTLGAIVVLRVGRMDTSLAFLAAFAGLHFCRNVLYLGWPLDFWTHQLMNGSLLLFTFFMITDPATTPNTRSMRILWAMIVGAAAFWMSWKLQIHTAPVWALVALSPLVPLLDKLVKGEKFSWKQ